MLASFLTWRPPATVLISLASIAAVAVGRRRALRRAKDAARHSWARARARNGGTCCVLNRFERENGHVLPPITTACIYRGACGDAVVQDLARRVAAVIRANPWLDGRLAPTPSGEEALYAPAAEGVDANSHVTVVDEPRLHLRIQTYAELNELLAPHALDGGRLGLSRGSLFEAVLLRGAQGRGAGGEGEACFALVLTMSHLLADGHTFYRIYRMLAGTAPVTALDPTRREPGRALPGAERDVWRRRGPQLRMVLEIIFGRPHRPIVLGVDQAAVSMHKAAHAPSAEAPFVSTHDVVTSQLLSALRADVGWFAVNARGRAPGLGAELAGNYEHLMLLFADEFVEAGGIRAVLRAWENPMHPRAPPWPRSLRSRIGVASSWVFGSNAMPLAGSPEQLAHLPVFDAMSPLPFRMAVIFEIRPGRLAVLSLTSNLALDVPPPPINSMPAASRPRLRPVFTEMLSVLA